MMMKNCDTLVDSGLDLDDDSFLVGFGDAVYGSLDGLEVTGAIFGDDNGRRGRRSGCRERVTACERHFQVAPTRTLRLLMVLVVMTVFLVNPQAPFLVVFFGLYTIRARRVRHALEPTVLVVRRHAPNPITIHQTTTHHHRHHHTHIQQHFVHTHPLHGVALQLLETSSSSSSSCCCYCSNSSSSSSSHQKKREGG